MYTGLTVSKDSEVEGEKGKIFNMTAEREGQGK
jgi:hypothetical protein